MKKSIVSSIQIMVLCLVVMISTWTLAYGQNQDTAAKVEALLKQMTVAEKIGQISQINIFYLMKNEWGRGGWSEAKLNKVLVDYAVGSILSGGSGYPDTNSPREWAKMTNMIQKYTEQTRLKIPIIYGVDAVHGHNNVKGAVIFPYDINVAAAGNPELADKSGELTAEALRATGIHWNFAPVLDIARNPKWGRTYETFGEDPYLASVMGASMIRGMQRSGKVAACAKHYVGYGAAETGFDRQPADISERTFREVLFPSFKAAVDAGVRTIMVNSGEVNGVPAHASKWLLNDILRKEFGFQGLVVSDWQDLQKIQTYHKAAPDLKTAIVRAYNAGIDMSMIPMNVDEIELLKEAVQEGLIPMERIDEAVRRVLYVKYELGLFENRYVDENQADAVVARDDQKETARMLARQSITLLKNSSNVLPLSKHIKNILVTGAAANSKSYLCGGWTIDWQGAQEEDLITGQTILEGIKTKVSAETTINYLDPSANREKLLQAAKDADVCLAVIGEKPYAETPGDIEDISLSKEQRAMLQTLQESGKPVVLVVVSGRPLIIDWEAQNLPAILYVYLPGTEGGNAVADVLFGDYNPAGRLPFTIPKRATQVPMRYNDRLTAAYDPLYPFGYGLSYTQFRYINLQVPEAIKLGEPLRVTVDVKNIGKIAGDHIVQMYYTNVYASVTPRRAQLCGFQRISLPPNETKTVTFEITPEQLKLYNEDMQFVEEARTITLQIGKLTQTVEIVAAETAATASSAQSVQTLKIKATQFRNNTGQAFLSLYDRMIYDLSADYWWQQTTPPELPADVFERYITNSPLLTQAEKDFMLGLYTQQGNAYVRTRELTQTDQQQLGNIALKLSYTMALPIVNGQAEFVLENVPAGKYYLFVFHDENQNGVMDLKTANGMQMPAEGIGVSNARSPLTGAPSFKTHNIALNQAQMELVIPVFYY